MAAFCVVINTDNAAFRDEEDGAEEIDHRVVRGLELGRILSSVANRVDAGAEQGEVADINGNTVGSFGPLETVITRAMTQ